MGVLKAHAFSCQLVQLWCGVRHRTAEDPDGIGIHVIDCDEEDVRLAYGAAAERGEAATEDKV